MNTKRFVSPTLVVCIAAGAFAAGALFVEPADSTSASPAPAALATEAPRGGYGGSGQASAPSNEATITISDFEISAVRVAPGARVTVVNRDDTDHTVTASNGSFSSGTVEGGRSVTFVAPSELGSYSVFCEFHPTMRSSVTVG